MIEKSRLRLSAGLVALTLALGACGGADKGALAPEPSSTMAQPSGTRAPSTTLAPVSPSSTASSTTAVPSSSSAAASTSADGSTQAEEPASEESSAEAQAGESQEAAAESPAEESVSEESTAAEDAQETADTTPQAEASAAQKPAPVAVGDSVDPAAQDLGGPKPGVAPKDTPVAVSTPKPQIPVEKVQPEDVRPAPAPKPVPTTAPAKPSSAAPSAPGKPTSGTPTAAPSTTPTSPATTPTAAPAPVGPVEQGAVDCSVTRCVALTFDDGPGKYTGRLLNILSAEQVPATFYVVGQSAELNPALIARMGAEGHQVGNHSYSHPNLTTLSASQVIAEMQRTDAAIRAAGVTPSTVRAPYGALNESVLADFSGLPRAGSVTWSVDTRDWEHKDPSQTLANVKAQTSAGGIILMHDIHATTVDAVPSVIAWLKGQGYTFVTVDEITGGVGSGRTVRSGMHP